MNEPPKIASKEQVHGFLIGDLTRQRSTLIDFAFRHGALLAVLLGWIVSSAEGLENLAKPTSLRRGFTLIILLYGILYWAWVRGMRADSVHTFRNLNKNGFMPQQFYAHLTISAKLAGSYIFIHSFTCAAIVVLAWW